MATRNIVPRANEEGNIGTTLKNWLKGWFKDLFVSGDITDGVNSISVAKIPEEGVWADYSATSTIVGWSSYTTKEIYTKKIGKTVFVAFNIQGTSDSTATTFTLPYTNTAGISVYNTYMGQDTGGGYAPYSLYLAATGSTVVFNVAGLSATWTASGAKGIVGQFFYEIA